MKLWLRARDVAGDLFAWSICIGVVLTLLALVVVGHALLWGAAAWAVFSVGRLLGVL